MKIVSRNPHFGEFRAANFFLERVGFRISFRLDTKKSCASNALRNFANKDLNEPLTGAGLFR